MRLFVIISVMSCLALASALRLTAIKRRHASKWDIIHHEYHGPPAPLAKDGRVIDTPEVALARANHLAIHAETVVDLMKKMAEAEAAEASAKKKAQEAEASSGGEGESAGGSEGASEGEAAPEAAPIVVQSVEVTPELMEMLSEAAAEEPKKEEEKKEEEKKEEEAAPAVEAAPVSEATDEAAPEAAAEAGESGGESGGEAAPAAEAAAEAPAAEGGEAAAEETKKEEESKPVVEAESESNNEVDAGRPHHIHQKNYEGPLAPLSEDGRVLDTPEVRKAKEAHQRAYEQAVKLAKIKQDTAKDGIEAWYEARKRLYVVPAHLVYHHDGSTSYKGPSAPIGKHGRVVDTEDVEKAKIEHKKAIELAEAIAKRHPPKAEDNLV